ncbi:MAG: DUF4867 family protein [Clostridia bacterium]|nr:DUF4867 family protein [Clostridia bacterium]
MLETLKKLNPNFPIYSIHDKEFLPYGKVLNLNTEEIVKACDAIPMPESGSCYELKKEELESLSCAEEIKLLTAGGCAAQIGLCQGYNSLLNGLEYHKCSEINIAATPLVLLLGLTYEMEDKEYSSDKIKAFYLEKGDAVEVYGTSMHFCPCQVSDEGFRCVVGLVEGTNDLLNAPSNDPLLFKKNKFLLCHDQNEGLIAKGVYPGLHGENLEVKYQ